MALALRLSLLLLLAVALHARAAQAAPVPARGADGDRDMDYLEILVDDALNFLEKPEGRPTGKKQDEEHTDSQESLEVLRQMLKEILQRGHEMDKAAVEVSVSPKGSSGSVPGSADGREAMPGTGTREAAGATTHGPDMQESIRRGFCSGMRCWIVIVACVMGWQLVITLCCAGMWYWWERKRPRSAPAPDQPDPVVRKKWSSHLTPPNPYLAEVPQLQKLLGKLPPKRAPLTLSPLALHSSQL